MTAQDRISPSLLEELRRLHDHIDAAAAELAARHRSRLRCGLGCAGCCVDGIEVLEIEAELVRRRHARLLAGAEPRPEGACAMLDPLGGCRIYQDRPAVCRSEGLPLRWFRGENEYRDICPLNDRGQPLTSLRPEDCWLVGPWEGRLLELQERATGGARRVALRSLFTAGSRQRAPG